MERSPNSGRSSSLQPIGLMPKRDDRPLGLRFVARDCDGEASAAVLLRVRRLGYAQTLRAA